MLKHVVILCISSLFFWSCSPEEKTIDTLTVNGTVTLDGASSKSLFLKPSHKVSDAIVKVSLFSSLLTCAQTSTTENGQFAFQLNDVCLQALSQGDFLLIEIEKRIPSQDSFNLISFQKLVSIRDLNNSISISSKTTQNSQLIMKWLFQHTLTTYNRQLLPIDPSSNGVVTELKSWLLTSMNRLQELDLKSVNCSQHVNLLDGTYSNQAHELIYLNCATSFYKQNSRMLSTIKKQQFAALTQIQKRLFTTFSIASIRGGYSSHYPKRYRITDEQSVVDPPYLMLIANRLDCDNKVNGSRQKKRFYKDEDSDTLGELRSITSCNAPKRYVLNSKDTFITRKINHGLSSVHDSIAGDLDLDGHPDIVVSSDKDKSLAILLMTNARQKARYTVNLGFAKPNALALGDVDGDGDQDICVGSEQDARLEWIETKINPKKITFKRHTVSSALKSIVDCQIIDVNNDGLSDIVVASWEDAKIIVFYQTDSGVFSPTELSVLTYKASSVEAVDMNMDKKIDVLASSYAKGDLELFESASPTKNILTGPTDRAMGLSDFTVADMNQDGWKDIVVASFFDDKVSIYYQTMGAFTREIVDSAIDGAKAVAVDDFNKDGRLDIAAIALDGRLRVYFQSARNSSVYKKSVVLAGLKVPVSLNSVDMNRDKRSDLITVSKMDNLLLWHQNILKN